MNKGYPFCGNQEPVIDDMKGREGKPFVFRIQCRECRAAVRWCNTEAEARAAWGIRAAVPAPVPEHHEKTPPTPAALESRLIHKDLFFHKGSLYARNPKPEYCYAGGKSGEYKRIKKADYQAAYEECAKVVRKSPLKDELEKD